MSWQGYLAAHRKRREFFATMGATSTDHGHPSANTEDLSDSEAKALFDRIVSGRMHSGEAEKIPRPDADGNGPHESG